MNQAIRKKYTREEIISQIESKLTFVPNGASVMFCSDGVRDALELLKQRPASGIDMPEEATQDICTAMVNGYRSHYGALSFVASDMIPIYNALRAYLTRQKTKMIDVWNVEYQSGSVLYIKPHRDEESANKLAEAKRRFGRRNVRIVKSQMEIDDE